MKNLFLITFCVSLLYSCTVIEFKTPQPNNVNPLKEFPEEIRGQYLFQYQDKEAEDSKDTITIGETYFQQTNNTRIFISDSLILKKTNNYYYYNGKSHDEQNWAVAIIELKENKNLMIYSLFNEEDEDSFIKQINLITPVLEIENLGKAKSFYINPTPQELSILINEKLFKPFIELKKLQE